MTRTHTRHSRSDTDTSTGSLIGDAVKSMLVTAGVAAIANLSRKAMTQAPTAMASDWCEGLIKEHRATLDAIDKLADVPADHTKRRAMLLAGIKHMIAKHALQEEQVIYPMLRRQDGTETLRSLNADHGEVKALLHDLGTMRKDDPAFLETLAELRVTLEEHMAEEEDELFPTLRNSLSEEENRKLTRAMNMAGVANA